MRFISSYEQFLNRQADCGSLDGLRKDELVAVLDEHLTKNATRLGGDATFKDYYGRLSSPTKRDPVASSGAAATSDGEPRTATRKRRVTRVKEETDVYVFAHCAPEWLWLTQSPAVMTIRLHLPCLSSQSPVRQRPQEPQHQLGKPHPRITSALSRHRRPSLPT